MKIAMASSPLPACIAKTTDICILVKGDLGAADLRGSWFSSVSP
jgi:hypothetical protein